MFNKFLKRLEKNSIILEKKEIENPIVEQKSTKTMEELIQEIHDTFYTECDRLLEIANNKNSLESKMQPLIEKRERLIKLGFTNTKEVREAQEEVDRLYRLQAENNKKQDLIDAINYFSLNYPTYKFITEESIKKICNKYNLVHGPISAYIGTVPDKNLKEMEDFKLREEDLCYEIQKEERLWINDQRMLNFKHVQYIGNKDYLEQRKSSYISYYHSRTIECTTEIAAPLKDFDLSKLQKEGTKLVAKPIEILDPVVTEPVFYKGNKYYLIKTAWGLESSDPEVLNEKLN